MRRRTAEQFKIELKSINDKIELLSDYAKSHEKVKCRCIVCDNIWYADPHHLLHKRGCPKCGRERSNKAKLESESHFLSRLSKVTNSIEILSNYKGSEKKVLCKCKKCGYEWSATPSNLYAGKGCSKCSNVYHRTSNDFLADIKKINPNIIVTGKYIKTTDRVKCKCKKCGHEWQPIASSLLQGTGCPNCAGTILKTNDAFINELSEKNPGVICLSAYKNGHTPLRFKCKECNHEWLAQPSKVLGGTGCPNCAGTLRKTNEVFLSELRNVDPDIIPLDEYARAHGVMRFKCAKCEYEWATTPHSVLQGHSCPKCAGNNKRTTSEFIDEVRKINKHIEIIGEYASRDERIKCKCKICGNEWSPVAGAIIAGQGCPKCNRISTSFMEQFIYKSLLMKYPDTVNRVRNAIDGELDIYVPSKKLAIEPGSWFWHKDKLENDVSKRRLCAEKGIKLITIYDSVPKNIIDVLESDDCWCFSAEMGMEREKTTLQTVVDRIFLLLNDEYKLSPEDYLEIEDYAYEHSRTRSREEFVKLVKASSPNTQIIGAYTGDSHNVRCRCRICGREWSTIASLILKGSGCRNCSAKKRGLKLRINEDTFISRVKSINSNIIIIGKYTGADNKVECKCRVCGNTWSPTPSNLYAGHGCPKCSAREAGNKTRASAEHFLARLNAVNKNVIVIGKYTGADNKIECKCKICSHIWSPTPSSLYAGCGCPNCYKLKRESKKAQTEILRHAKST